jgi:hypothetical protein
MQEVRGQGGEGAKYREQEGETYSKDRRSEQGRMQRVSEDLISSDVSNVTPARAPAMAVPPSDPSPFWLRRLGLENDTDCGRAAMRDSLEPADIGARHVTCSCHAVENRHALAERAVRLSSGRIWRVAGEGRDIEPRRQTANRRGLRLSYGTADRGRSGCRRSAAGTARRPLPAPSRQGAARPGRRRGWRGRGRRR